MDDIVWKPMTGPLVYEKRHPLPSFVARPAEVVMECELVRLVNAVDPGVFEVQHDGARPYIEDTEGRRWLLDGSGEVA